MVSIQENIQHWLVDTTAVVGGLAFGEVGSMVLKPEIRDFVIHNPVLLIEAILGGFAVALSAPLIQRYEDQKDQNAKNKK